MNHDLLEQREVIPPGPTWTIDQSIEIARRVTVHRETEQESTWGFHQHWAVITHFPYSWIRGNGGDPLVSNEPIAKAQWSTDTKTVKTVQWLVDLSHKLGVMPVEPVGGVLGTFREGRLALGVMEVNNLFLIPQGQAQGGAQFRWDVQQLPAMAKGRYFPDRGFAYGMARNTKDPPANKKSIVDSLLAVKPMPKHPRWWEMDQGITIKALADTRAAKVSVNEGLTTLDRQLNALLQPPR